MGARKGDRSALIGLVFCGGLFVLLFVGLGLALGFSGPGVPSGAVALVEGGPGGKVTLGPADLRQAIEQHASFAGLEKPPEAGSEEYDRLEEESLSELISAIWLKGEGEERGIHVSEQEIARKLRQSGERASLESDHFTPATIDERIRTQLLVEKIEASLEEPGLSQAEQAERFYEFDEDFQQAWRSRTRCADDFVVALCANYLPGYSAVAPPACYEESPKEPADACPAPVAQRSAVQPGTVTSSKPDGKALPQGPYPESVPSRPG